MKREFNPRLKEEREELLTLIAADVAIRREG